MQFSPPRIGRFAGTLLLGINISTSVVTAQSVAAVRSLSLVTRAVVSGLVTLLAGGAFFVFAPETAEGTMEQARSDPLGCFGWGVGVAIIVTVVTLILAATGIGLIIAISLLLAFAVVVLAGQAVVFILLVSRVFAMAPPVERALLGAVVFAAVSSFGRVAIFVRAVVRGDTTHYSI